MSGLNFEEIENYDQPPTPSINSKFRFVKYGVIELRAEEDDMPPSPPPLSLANVLLECPPTPWINSKKMKLKLKESRAEKTTTTKPYSFGSIRDSLRRQIWCKDDSLPVCKELPVEIWGEIGKRISIHLDILRFRSVCKSSRSSLPSPTRFPLLVPPLPKSVDPNEAPSLITELSVFSQSWNGGYIVLTKVRGDKLYIDRRFTSWWGAILSPYDRKLSFVSKAHHLFSYDSTRLDYFLYNLIKRIVVVSSDRDEANVNASYAKLCDLSIVGLVQDGDMKGRLCLLRLRGSPESWAWETDFCTRLFDDVASYRGRVCALEPQGSVVILDFDEAGLFKMTQLAFPSYHIGEMIAVKYMYEDSGELYLALGDSTWTKYKLIVGNEKLDQKSSWVKVDPKIEGLLAQCLPFV